MYVRICRTAAVLALVSSAWAGSASAATLKGTVVHLDKRAHSFALANRAGRLTEVHAAHLPAVGRSVTVRARQLRNGTFAASRVRLTGHRSAVRVRGLVTFVDRAHNRFVVSFHGGSLVVNRGHAARGAHAGDLRALLAADVTLPAVGTEVTVDGSVDDQGDIDAHAVEDDGQNTDAADLEGRVLSVDATLRTVTISADDDDEIAGASITIDIPQTFDMTGYQVGDVLELVATPNPDGTYTAVDTSQDGSTGQADGQHGQQGDDGGDGSTQQPGDGGDSTSGHTGSDSQD